MTSVEGGGDGSDGGSSGSASYGNEERKRYDPLLTSKRNNDGQYSPQVTTGLPPDVEWTRGSGRDPRQVVVSFGTSDAKDDVLVRKRDRTPAGAETSSSVNAALSAAAKQRQQRVAAVGNGDINGSSRDGGDGDGDGGMDAQAAAKAVKVGSERVKVRVTLRRLFGEAKPEACTIIAATFAMFMSAVFNLAIPALFGRIIDAIANKDAPGARDNLQENIIALVVVGALGACFTFARRYLYAIAGEKVVARLHRKLFHAIMQQEVGFYDVTRTGELLSRLTSDTSALKHTVTSHVSMSLRWVSTVIGGILFLFYESWKLTLVMVTVTPAVAFGAVYYGRYVRDLSKQSRRALARSTEVAEESISAIRTVRSFAREPLRESMFSKRVETALQLGLKSALASGVFAGCAQGAFVLSFVAIIYYGGNLVLDGELTSGDLTSFLLYSLTIGGALAGLASLFGDLMKSVGATDRVFQILDRKPFVPVRGGKTLDSVEGDVQFKNVNFAYPTRPDQVVLKDISFRIAPGTVAALVGPSGGGKSTVVNLIERFYDVGAGQLSLDGVEVCALDPSWMRGKVIGLVRQEPQLFCATIAENIAFGVESATMSDIISAAVRANAHDFVSAFPDGYDTYVGERGVRLSGGQKQRIAIARALLKDPKVLLLDEATSALDAESEHLVQEALERLMVGRTVLIIAHRLSTVKNAHMVMVLDEGSVQACGSHDELMQSSPLYAKLVKHQLMQADAELAAMRARGVDPHAIDTLTSGAASDVDAAPYNSDGNANSHMVDAAGDDAVVVRIVGE